MGERYRSQAHGFAGVLRLRFQPGQGCKKPRKAGAWMRVVLERSEHADWVSDALIVG
jgi:hypothetical protein